MAFYEMDGTVEVVGEEQTFASGFRKVEVVVKTDAEKYPQSLKFEVVKDNIEKIKDVEVGDAVHVRFDIRGNEYQSKFYVSLAAFSITCKDKAPKAENAQTQAERVEDDTAGEQLPF